MEKGITLIMEPKIVVLTPIFGFFSFPLALWKKKALFPVVLIDN